MKRLLIMVIAAVALLSGCALYWSNPDDGPSLITPLSIYYAAQGGMIALENKDATAASIVCAVASEQIWPILESASGATIELKETVIKTLTAAAKEAGLKDEWLAYMAPGLGLLNEVFNPEIVFQDNWLPILKGFAGGVIDQCEGTDTHRPGTSD